MTAAPERPHPVRYDELAAEIDCLDHSTQQNAALVEDASAATESLKAQSQRLVQMLDRFRTA